MRNISEADIDFSATINFLKGENGAGKTTVLEAIYLLARSKSFSKGNQNALIQSDKENLTLFLNGTKCNGESVRIGFFKDKKRSHIKVNGEPIKKLSDLARNFPIVLITPQTHKILEEGPEYRRRLLNWGVFHVEHRYGALITNYNRVLNQRNQALKDNIRNIAIWDDQLLQYASQITSIQSNYVEAWFVYLDMLTSKMKDYKNISVKYYQGWDKGLSLSESLSKKYQLDKRRGFTSVGPHRSDLIFEIDEKPIKGYLSRGQQKKLIILLKIAQSIHMKSLSGELPVLLMDDFQSELDEKTQFEILSLVNENKIQTIISGIQNLTYLSQDIDPASCMFHVEQGTIRSLPYESV